jgi:hypothetical protein
MLLRLLTSRFHVGQRRPDKFAVHNASFKDKSVKKIPTLIIPDRAVRNSKSQAAAFPGEIRTDPLD